MATHFGHTPRTYRSMFQGLGGLGNSFICRDDFDERVRANAPFDQGLEQLAATFATVVVRRSATACAPSKHDAGYNQVRQPRMPYAPGGR
jgi:hypothetical protein